MKKTIIIVSIALLAVFMAASCKSSTGKEKESTQKEVAKVQYTCPMHPEVLSDKPGNCTKCGMALVEKK